METGCANYWAMLYMEKHGDLNEKDYLKCRSKPSCLLHKKIDNNLVAIRKSKLALKLNKRAYIEMCILDLSKVLMYEFPFDYIKNKYDNKSKLSQTLIV